MVIVLVMIIVILYEYVILFIKVYYINMIKKKASKEFFCSSCGANFLQWFGQCNICNEWGSIKEFRIRAENQVRNYPSDCNSNYIDNDRSYNNNIIDAIHLSQVDSAKCIKNLIGISEFDRALGGGFVNGSAILIGGPPGAGKSTLMLQVLEKSDLNSIYISAEESISQIKIRAERLGFNCSSTLFSSVNVLEDILEILISKKSNIIVIDSIQTIYSTRLASVAGSVQQVKYCADELIKFIKRTDSALFIVGQITKDGQIAGPMVLEHMVDTVLFFEEEKTGVLRVLRTMKNRFGPSNEIGIFEMSKLGLIEIQDPSQIFIDISCDNVSGNVIFPSIEGTRMMLMEVQSLAIDTYMSIPRRSAIGCDINRLNMIMAVLASRCSIFFDKKEVYINIANGVKVNDTAVDLAIAVSLLSSHFNIPISLNIAFFGEVSLSGKIKSVAFELIRIQELKRLGFKKIVCNTKKISEAYTGIEIFRVKHIYDLVEYIHDKQYA